MNTEKQQKDLVEGLRDSSFAKANLALKSLEHFLDPKQAAREFGAAIERAFHEIFEEDLGESHKRVDAEDLMMKRLNAQSGMLFHTSRLVFTLAQRSPDYMDEYKAGVVRLASSLIGAKEHLEWIQENDLDQDPPEIPHFYQVDTEQRCFLGALVLRAELDKNNIFLSKEEEGKFFKAMGEVYDFKSGEFTGFGQEILLFETDYFKDCYMNTDYSHMANPEFFERMGALCEALELENSLSPERAAEKSRSSLKSRM